jgi:hypothetical protein
MDSKEPSSVNSKLSAKELQRLKVIEKQAAIKRAKERKELEKLAKQQAKQEKLSKSTAPSVPATKSRSLDSRETKINNTPHEMKAETMKPSEAVTPLLTTELESRLRAEAEQSALLMAATELQIVEQLKLQAQQQLETAEKIKIQAELEAAEITRKAKIQARFNAQEAQLEELEKQREKDKLALEAMKLQLLASSVNKSNDSSENTGIPAINTPPILSTKSSPYSSPAVIIKSRSGTNSVSNSKPTSRSSSRRGSSENINKTLFPGDNNAANNTFVSASFNTGNLISRPIAQNIHILHNPPTSNSAVSNSPIVAQPLLQTSHSSANTTPRIVVGASNFVPSPAKPPVALGKSLFDASLPSESHLVRPETAQPMRNVSNGSTSASSRDYLPNLGVAQSFSSFPVADLLLQAEVRKQRELEERLQMQKQRVKMLEEKQKQLSQHQKLQNRIHAVVSNENHENRPSLNSSASDPAIVGIPSVPKLATLEISHGNPGTQLQSNPSSSNNSRNNSPRASVQQLTFQPTYLPLYAVQSHAQPTPPTPSASIPTNYETPISLVNNAAIPAPIISETPRLNSVPAATPGVAAGSAVKPILRPASAQHSRSSSIEKHVHFEDDELLRQSQLSNENPFEIEVAALLSPQNLQEQKEKSQNNVESLMKPVRNAAVAAPVQNKPKVDRSVEFSPSEEPKNPQKFMTTGKFNAKALLSRTESDSSDGEYEITSNHREHQGGIASFIESTPLSDSEDEVVRGEEHEELERTIERPLQPIINPSNHANSSKTHPITANPAINAGAAAAAAAAAVELPRISQGKLAETPVDSLPELDSSNSAAIQHSLTQLHSRSKLHHANHKQLNKSTKSLSNSSSVNNSTANSPSNARKIAAVAPQTSQFQPIAQPPAQPQHIHIHIHSPHNHGAGNRVASSELDTLVKNYTQKMAENQGNDENFSDLGSVASYGSYNSNVSNASKKSRKQWGKNQSFKPAVIQQPSDKLLRTSFSAPNSPKSSETHSSLRQFLAEQEQKQQNEAILPPALDEIALEADLASRLHQNSAEKPQKTAENNEKPAVQGFWSVPLSDPTDFAENSLAAERRKLKKLSSLQNKTAERENRKAEKLHFLHNDSSINNNFSENVSPAKPKRLIYANSAGNHHNNNINVANMSRGAAAKLSATKPKTSFPADSYADVHSLQQPPPAAVESKEFSAPKGSNAARSNRKLLENAIQFVCLAGSSCAAERTETLLNMRAWQRGEHFIILLKKQNETVKVYKGLYWLNFAAQKAHKIIGERTAPESIDTGMIETCYKYESAAKKFNAINKGEAGFTLITDAVALKRK